MKLTIITPTILRTTLANCIDSVAMQTFRDYEHLIIVDRPDIVPPDSPTLMGPNIRWVMLGRSYGFFGNVPRRIGAQAALGEYITYLDDDDIYIEETAVAVAMKRLQETGALWGTTQMIVEYNKRPVVFSGLEAKVGSTGTNQIWHRRVMPDGLQPAFPESKEYTADGVFAAELARQYGPPTALSDHPVVSVRGVGGGRWF